MKHTLLLLSLLVPVFSHASSLPENTNLDSAGAIQSPIPKLSAKAYLLFDHNSKQVLLEQNSHEHIAPASLTKLMTAHIIFSALRQHKLALTDKITPSVHALRTQREDSQMYLNHDKAVTVDDLLHGLIIVSANDAARVLAENLSGSEASFVELMNNEAQRLGMVDTHFANATGLPDPLHYSSAYDLAILTDAVINDFPEYFPLYSQREFEYNHIKHYNRNRLLWMDPYVDGMKTGHTESAGYCLIATANRNNHRLISVVLGSNSDNLRSSESQRLLNYGYQDFDVFYLYKKDQAVSSVRLWKGTENAVRMGVREGLTITLPKGQRPLLKAMVETQQPLLAPIGNGQQIGILKLTLDGKPYQAYPLVALESVPLVNIFSRGIDSIRMIFSR
jgi:serine-type D-Ala-D-Ala carboxypeptidase (penicillin-binding protein 5/6)